MVPIDLRIELSGRIESGGDFGIVMGGRETMSGSDGEMADEEETWLTANDA